MVDILKVVDMYKNIVDQMKCYEKSKLSNWLNNARSLAVHQMDSNILVCVRSNSEMSKSN